MQGFAQAVAEVKNLLNQHSEQAGIAQELERARECFQAAIAAIRQLRALLGYSVDIEGGKLVFPSQNPGSLEALAASPLVDGHFVEELARSFNV